jgi:multicomponent Na+:H+ antiporter subunit G
VHWPCWVFCASRILVLLGVAFAAGEPAVAARCVLGFLFLILTGPVSAHLLARSAFRSGTAPGAKTSIQEYQINQ